MPPFVASRDDSDVEIDLSTRNACAPASANPQRRARILIVSDVRLFSEALGLRLGQHPEMSIVAVGGDAALAAAADAEPDIVLLDMGELKALAIAQDLAGRHPDLRIVGIGAPASAGAALAAACPAMVGVIPREGALEDVVDLLERLTGASAIHSVATRQPIGEAAHAANVDSKDALTAREHEILQLIERGLSNKEIARMLRIEVGTVKNHVHNVLQKLQVRGRGEAAHSMRKRSSASRGEALSMPIVGGAVALAAK